MERKDYKLSDEEANLIDEITAKYKLPFAVKGATIIYDCEEDRDMNLVEGLSYIEEAIGGNEDTISQEELSAFRKIIDALGMNLQCPLGGDETNDCEDCAYSGDYHFVNGECLQRDEPQPDENKKWYTVTFQAKMNDDNIRAMKKYFYDTMEQSMQINKCRCLDIIDDCDQDN